jgi:hypothetical protein
MFIQTLMTKRLEVPIFSIIATVEAVSVTLLITAATYRLTDFVFAQGQPKFGFIKYKYNI